MSMCERVPLCLHLLARGVERGFVYRPIHEPSPNIDKVPSNGCCRGHFRRDQMGPPAASLAAFKVPVRSRGAALAGRENVRIHAQAHRTTGLAPIEACLDEYAIKSFGFGLRLHGL